jgi:hypothetical protein
MRTDATEHANRHSVDRLAELRQQTASLQAEEAELRAMVLAGEVSAEGEEFRAQVSMHIHRGIDAHKARELLPPKVLRLFEQVSSFQVVRLRRKHVPRRPRATT